MKNKIRLTTLAMFLASANLHAHQPAAEVVDEEIYDMIELMVEDTPHAKMTFEEIGGGLSEATITTQSLDDFETLVKEQELLDYVEKLEGVVDVLLSFNDDNSVTMTVSQIR